MKKNIGYINLEKKYAKMLLEQLPSSSFRDGIKDLSNGEYSSLIIEMDNEEQDVSKDLFSHYGELKICEKKRYVEKSGREIQLTPKEYDILLFLTRNRGEVFTKEQIYKAVWEDDYVMDDSNIMAFIRKLRKKIETNPDAPEYILTIWGIGYKFNDKI